MVSANDVKRQAPVNSAANGCILLFGMPRSGTTWLGKLFDSHPDTLYRHEPDTWRRLDMPRYPAVADSVHYAPQLRSFVSNLPHINALRVAGKQPLFAKTYLSTPRLWWMKAGVSLARAGSRLYPDFRVFSHRPGQTHPRRRIVWKSIESLARMGTMLDAVADATAIQILRHPCGYIASVLRGLEANRFSDNTSSSDDYGIFKAAIGTSLGDRYGLTLEQMRSASPVERLAWSWVLINEKALLETAGSQRARCVRYEDICDDPVAGVQRMFDFCGLEMNHQTRAFIAESTGAARDGYYSVFKDPERAAWRWREELDAETIERIMSIVRRSRIGAYYSDEATNTQQVYS